MIRIYVTFLVVCFLNILTAQDAHHQQLIETFETTYQIPIGEWVFFDNEEAILSTAGGYGGSYTIQESTDTDFSKVVKASISRAGANAWDSGWSLRNQQRINVNDKVLMVFSIRSIGGAGKVNIIAENSSTFAKEVFFTVDISESWTHYFIPFKSSQTYTPNSMTLGFHLANQAQEIEIGGFTAMNFKDQVTLADLPNQVNNDQYGGAEADAPWRANAAERIEQLRKAKLTILVSDGSGFPVEGAKMQVKMLRHDFAFGSAVNAARIAGNNDQNNIYESKILDLDGKGHGFNWVVFENDMKWPAFENNWLVTPPELANAVQWLRGNEIQIRGHTLVWPGDNNMPNDIKNNSNNLPYIQERINGHLETILNYPGIKGEVAEWDVLNEITTNRSLENYFKGKEGYTTGREILTEIFHKTHELDPATGLWLNDYVTISTGSKPGNANYDNLKIFTQELLDAGVPLEGLGFQGHIGGFPNSIPSVLETLDDFYNEFGLKAKITEYDMPSFVDEELAATYLGDFLTAIFSHESMNGFLFWSFWDGATWIQGGTKSNFFQLDWTPNKSLEVFNDLVFNQWWTEEEAIADAGGLIQLDVFKGDYEVSYEINGEIIRETLSIVEDQSLEIVANNITTDTEELSNESAITVFPNPSTGQVVIHQSNPQKGTIKLYDLLGNIIFQQSTHTSTTQIHLPDLKGLFLLHISGKDGSAVRKITFE